MKRTPTATYRLQLHEHFGFADAQNVLDYLQALGVSDVYTSPYLRAEPHSSHGYDVVDPTQLNPELGSAEDYRRFTDAIALAGMGHILDIVPNHMGIGGGNNVWWNDVLENGPSSRFADYFDIEWAPPKAALRDRILLAVLGDSYGAVLERGELSLERRGDAFVIRYFDHTFPVAPKSLGGVLEATKTSALDEVIAAYNAKEGIEKMDALLSQQSYRLSDWRVASEEINYRRFFDVNALAAVRSETPEVFALLHGLVLRLIGDGRITGLRLDHVDGLLDPADYLRRLNEEIRAVTGDDLYVVAEKILEPGEVLPPWPLAGTTGYDFIGLLSPLWNDPEGEKALEAIYQSATGRAWRFEDVAYAAKQVIMRSSLASEITLLAQMLERLADGDRRSRDFTLTALRRAIVETIAGLGVYRTYVRADGSREPGDARFIEQAIARARRQDPAINSAVLAFLRDVLLLDTTDPERKNAWAKFTLRFQQVSSPVMAKAIEDTAFYVRTPLLSLNEVGCVPSKFSLSVDDFHKANAERGLRWPLAMVSSGTHDSKRGEDARARLAVLSEAPDLWQRWVATWRELAAPLRNRIDEEPAPSRDDEYFFYQTALGACPYEIDWASLADRFAAHLLKASKEAKLRTSWLNPDAAYEKALDAFVRSLLGTPAFRESLLEARDTIAIAGACNSLAQTALKCAVPGVPDIYQGSELWNFDLVDPDNRRPVDYARRRALLASRLPADWQKNWRDGSVKAFVTRVALLHRARAPALFARGTYEALVGGKNLVAFARVHEGATLVCVVPRLPWALARQRPAWPLGEVWGEQTLTLPPGEYENAFTTERFAGRVALRHLFATFPQAWLIKL